jgi:hypothetical protein
VNRSIFVHRRDLCRAFEVDDYYWAKDFGSILRRGQQKWWATNDVRRDLVGVLPNEELAQPTPVR